MTFIKTKLSSFAVAVVCIFILTTNPTYAGSKDPFGALLDSVISNSQNLKRILEVVKRQYLNILLGVTLIRISMELQTKNCLNSKIVVT